MIPLLRPPPGSKKTNRLTRRESRARMAYRRFCDEFEKYMEQNMWRLDKVYDYDGVQFESEGGIIKDWETVRANIRDLTDIIDFEYVFNKKLSLFTGENFIKIANEYHARNLSIIRARLNAYIKKLNKTHNDKELQDINSNLTGRLLANFSGTPVPEALGKIICNGRKFSPFFHRNDKENREQFFEDLCNVLEGLVLDHGKMEIKPKTMIKDIVHALSSPSIDNITSKLLELTLDELENPRFANILNTNDLKQKFPQEGLQDRKKYKRTVNKEVYEAGLALVETDKNLGFTMLKIEQIMKLYNDINKVQGYTRVDITEEDYLKLVHRLKKENCPVIPQQVKWMINKKMLANFYETRGCIAILRLLAKSGKIDNPCEATFPKLTARTVKAGVNDPINGISDILRSIAQNFILGLKRLMLERYGRVFTVVGTNDAYEQMTRVKEQYNLTDAINLNADITEMYPNTVFSVVRLATIEVGRLLRVHKDIVDFVIGGIFVVMKCNYVRQPTGVFHMDRPDPALSIGDPAAAEISDYTIMAYEINMIQALENAKLSQHLLMYLRFRDDIDAKIGGTQEEKDKVIHLIFSFFPKCYHLKANVSVISSKFLDIKRVVNLEKKEWLTVLRKKNNAYDITRFSSNTWKSAKEAAMNTYVYRMLRNTNSRIDYEHQLKVYKLVLKSRGIPDGYLEHKIKDLKKREKIRKTTGGLEKEELIKHKRDKKFLKPVTFNMANGNDKRIKQFLKQAGVLKFYRSPGNKPSDKVLPIIYTKSKFIKGVQGYLGMPVSNLNTFKLISNNKVVAEEKEKKNKNKVKN